MPESETLRVTIIDDHALFREGLVIAERLNPDIAILDLELPDVSGVRVIGSFLEASPDSKIMVETMFSKIGYIAKSCQAGAMGYVVKDSASDSLRRARLSRR